MIAALDFFVFYESVGQPLYSSSFKNFNNLNELAESFKGRDLSNAVDELLNNGWTKEEGNWGG